MNRTKTVFKIIVLILISCIALANNSYIPSGHSGYYLKTEVATYSQDLFRVYSGYVTKNGLNINAVLGVPLQFLSDPDVRYSTTPLQGEALFGVDLGYLLLRQDKNKPSLNLSVNTSYRMGLNWYAGGSCFTNNYLRIGWELSERAVMSERLIFIPSFSFDLCLNIYSYPNSYYGFGPMEGWHDYVVFSLGLDVLLKDIFLFWNIDYTPGIDIKDLFAEPWRSSRLGIGFILPNKKI